MRKIITFSTALLAAGLLLTMPSSAAGKKVELFNGKDLTGWKLSGGQGARQWKVGKAALDPSDDKKLVVAGTGNELVSCEKGANLTSDAKFGDCHLEFEFMVSKDSNAGVKLMNIYEIQILDSYGKAKAGDSDNGAVYKESAPKVNASKKPGEWQKLVIDFRAPRFDATGNKTANAKFVKVVLNGQVVQEEFEIAHGTNVSRNAKEYPTGNVFFQGDHGPVALRNIVITPES